MQGINSGRMALVVEQFYEAAGRPELWTPALAAYADAAGAMGAILLPGPADPIMPTATESLGEATVVGARDGWYANNPRVARGVKAVRGPEDIITEERIFRPDEIDREPFYSDFLHRCGGGWFAGMVLVDAGPSSLFLSLERSRAQGLFERGEVAEIAKFSRHLKQAGRLATRMSGARAGGILSGLDMLSCGGILVDAAGRVVDLNAKAERSLGDGLRIVARRPEAVDPLANAVLQRLVGSLVRSGPVSEAPVRAPVAVPRAARRPLVVHGAPIAASLADVFRRGRAVLMVVDPEEHPEPTEPILRQAFSLTGAECRVAIALSRGRDPAQIARAFGVGEATVRTQIKAIFAKTETRRQAELVALLGRMTSGGLSLPR